MAKTTDSLEKMQGELKKLVGPDNIKLFSLSFEGNGDGIRIYGATVNITELARVLGAYTHKGNEGTTILVPNLKDLKEKIKSSLSSGRKFKNPEVRIEAVRQQLAPIFGDQMEHTSIQYWSNSPELLLKITLSPQASDELGSAIFEKSYRYNLQFHNGGEGKEESFSVSERMVRRLCEDLETHQTLRRIFDKLSEVAPGIITSPDEIGIRTNFGDRIEITVPKNKHSALKEKTHDDFPCFVFPLSKLPPFSGWGKETIAEAYERQVEAERAKIQGVELERTKNIIDLLTPLCGDQMQFIRIRPHQTSHGISREQDAQTFEIEILPGALPELRDAMGYRSMLFSRIPQIGDMGILSGANFREVASSIREYQIAARVFDKLDMDYGIKELGFADFRSAGISISGNKPDGVYIGINSGGLRDDLNRQKSWWQRYSHPEGHLFRFNELPPFTLWGGVDEKIAGKPLGISSGKEISDRLPRVLSEKEQEMMAKMLPALPKNVAQFAHEIDLKVTEGGQIHIEVTGTHKMVINPSLNKIFGKRYKPDGFDISEEAFNNAVAKAAAARAEKDGASR